MSGQSFRPGVPVRRGFGIAPLPKDVAMIAPELACVLPELDPIPMPIWLVTHRELHTSRRIRLVFDLLAEALAPIRDGSPAR